MRSSGVIIKIPLRKEGDQMLEKIRRQMTVSGKVQGVGFRYFTCEVAKSSEIKGFVKNEPDGSVYIDAEGDAKNMSVFIHEIKKGPTYGHITEIKIKKTGELKGYIHFTVKY
jgi:acylphosphatase